MNQNLTKIFLLLTSFSIGILWYYGAFLNVEVNKSLTGPYHFVYFNRVGTYESSRIDWEKTVQLMIKTFNHSIPAGIYYDNPHSIVDPNQSRLSIGFFVKEREVNKIESFIKLYPNFKHSFLPQVESALVDFPYRSLFSFQVMKYKVYPALMKYILEQNLYPSCILEVYNFGGEKMDVQFFAPFGKDSTKYILV